jgi:hypothetical protein
MNEANESNTRHAVPNAKPGISGAVPETLVPKEVLYRTVHYTLRESLVKCIYTLFLLLYAPYIKVKGRMTHLSESEIQYSPNREHIF